MSEEPFVNLPLLFFILADDDYAILLFVIKCLSNIVLR